MTPRDHDIADQRLRAAVEAAPSGLIMTDEAGLIVMVNREVERMFGYHRDELMGRTVDTLIPARFRHEHPGHRARFRAHPRVRAMGAGRDLFAQRRNGDEFPVEIGLTPVSTDDGMCMLATIVDITARRTAEAERRKLEEQLRQSQKLDALGALAGGIAHDFNNVLGAIVGYGELVRERLDDAEDRQDMDALLRAAARGRQVVDRILRFTRRQESVRRRVTLDQPLREAVELLHGTLPAGIDLEVALGGDAPAVLADATVAHQVLLNLATNSAHAIAGTGIRSGDAATAPPSRGRIHVGLFPVYARDTMVKMHPDLREGSYAVLEVRDNGGGMPPDVLARATEPFFSTKDEGVGTGLGLAMVRSLMQDHEGAVVIESERGAGTVVRCYFPAADAATAEVPAAVAARPSLKGSGERIYYLDDQADLADLGARRLRNLGYEATAFSDPHAVELTVSADPLAVDLVITDLTMPVMDGVELARRLKARRPDLPVMLMTGRPEAVTGAQLAEVGIATMLRKPAALEELAQALSDLLHAPAGD